MPGARGGLPIRYARDLRPLAAIPLDAISASLHRPLIGTPRCAWASGGTHEYVAVFMKRSTKHLAPGRLRAVPEGMFFLVVHSLRDGLTV